MNGPTEIPAQEEEGQPDRDRGGSAVESKAGAIHPRNATRVGRKRGLAWRLPVSFFALLVLTGLLACERKKESAAEPTEIVDVAAPRDAALSFEDDVQSQRRQEGLAGVLPGGFPTDLPVLEPASVVDAEPTEDGRMSVVIQHPVAPEEVEAFLARAWPAAGWTADGTTYHQTDGRSVEATVEAISGVTRLRIVY